jgi:hypothetical protein
LVDGDPTIELYLHLDDNPTPHSHGLGPFTNWDENSGAGGALEGESESNAVYESADRTKDDLPNLPITYDASSAPISLVASIERNTTEEGGGWVGDTSANRHGQIASYCFVTVLDAPPADGANGADTIRPNIVGDTKYMLDFDDDFDWASLPSDSNIGSSTTQELADYAELFRHSADVFAMRYWDGSEDEIASEAGRAFRPSALYRPYGAQATPTLVERITALAGTNTLAEKKEALAAAVAFGLDAYHAIYSTTNNQSFWSSGAGQFAGLSIPVYFSAAYLDDTDNTLASWQDNLRGVPADNWSANSYERGPQTMRQIMRGRTGVQLWGGGDRIRIAATETPRESVRVYWGEFFGNRRWDGSADPQDITGQKTQGDPHLYIDGPVSNPMGGYADTSAGPARLFAFMCLTQPKFLDVVNTTDIIEYVDRFMTHGRWAYPDPLAIPTATDMELGWPCHPIEQDGSQCEDYRTLWGPSAADWRFAIEDGTGRHISFHGTDLEDFNPDSWSYQGYSWADLISGYTGPTWEDWVVDIDRVPAPDIYTYPDGGSHYALLRCGLDDATMYYTTDGSTPTTSDSVATQLVPIAISEGAIVKAIAVKTGYTDSGITTKTDGDADGYTVTGGGDIPTPPVPVVAPPVRYNAIGGAPVWAY